PAGPLTASSWAHNHDSWFIPPLPISTHVPYTTLFRSFIQNSTSGDKTYSLAAQLIAAKLNIDCGGADSSCVALAIIAADAWLVLHPVGSGVTSNSAAWKQVKAAYNTLTDYNEGRLCAPKCRS